RGPAQRLLGTPWPENPDSHQPASQPDGLTNRRMRARMSGGVGGGGATPSPTRLVIFARRQDARREEDGPATSAGAGHRGCVPAGGGADGGWGVAAVWAAARAGALSR